MRDDFSLIRHLEVPLSGYLMAKYAISRNDVWLKSVRKFRRMSGQRG